MQGPDSAAKFLTGGSQTQTTETVFRKSLTELMVSDSLNSEFDRLFLELDNVSGARGVPTRVPAEHILWGTFIRLRAVIRTPRAFEALARAE